MNLLAAVLGFFSLSNLWEPEVPAAAVNHGPFENYQISPPTADFGEPVHTVELLDHVFAASWGQPYTVPYAAPDLEFSHVKFTMEVSSFGVQYDRLAHVFFNGIELWRPSTSEPRGKRSHSSYTKDMSQFRSLLEAPGALSVELDNLVTERLDGTFHVRLSAQYFAAPEVTSNAWFEHEGVPAAAIVPVLNCSVATDRVSKPLPRVAGNTTRAILQVFASGNGNDEFWYAESSQEDELGPIRNLNVEVNGELVGVVTPFYQVYTGGIQPALWSPFVAPNAYDVPAYHLDFTNLLPRLWESVSESEPELELSLVVTNGRDAEVHHEWILSAALLTWESAELEGIGGTVQPTEEKNTSRVVLLPSIEVAGYQQTLLSAAELQFRNLSSQELVVHAVEVAQLREIEASLVGETIVSHQTNGKSATSYNARNYSLAYYYDIALVLEENSVTTAIAMDLYEHDYSATEELLSRSQSVHYNGSWFLDELHHHDHHEHKVNGSDVFVKFRDPHRNGQVTFSQHAISRNGSVVTLDAPPTTGGYKSNLIESSLPHLAGFPFVTPSAKEMRERKQIRHKWLHHGI